MKDRAKTYYSINLKLLFGYSMSFPLFQALAMRMYPLLHRLLEQRDAQMSKLQELSRPVQRRPLGEDKPHQEGSEDFEGEEPNDEREEIFLFSPTENNSFFFFFAI